MAEPEIEDIGGEASNGGESGSSGLLGAIPNTGLSRRQLLLLVALVALAVVVWKARQNGGESGGSEAGSEIEKAKDPDLGDVTIREQEDAEDVEVVVPASPDDELKKDAAIIDYFKESGHIEGGDD